MANWQLIITIVFAFAFPISSAAIINYLERKIMARMQDRAGPLHTGTHGSMQLFADIEKCSSDGLGIVTAGWGSNNKYALIGGLRATAQMIAYELPLVLALVGIVMLTSVLSNTGSGTISIKGILSGISSSRGILPGPGLYLCSL